ncbi:MAG: hypothetical protein ABI217_08480, partial [Chthoniobacterales bacterium]
PLLPVSTRANIVLTDGADELIFYRHSDGYPEGTLPTLKQFLNLVDQGTIRDHVGQAAGWLILIGAREYGVKLDRSEIDPPSLGAGMQWKVGAYEPTTGLHGDIEFLYVVDLEKRTIRHHKVAYASTWNPRIPFSFYSGRFNECRPDSNAPKLTMLAAKEGSAR